MKLGLPGLFVAWIATPGVILFMYFFGTRMLKMGSKTLVIIIAAAFAGPLSYTEVEDFARLESGLPEH